jgi:hypothetical protein
MDAILEIFSYLGQFFTALKINPMYVLLWVAAGYIQQVYLTGYKRIGPVWKTFVLGSLFSLVYAILLRNVAEKGTWVEFFASYLFATSMYEMWIKGLVTNLIKKVQTIFNKKLEA